MDKKSLIIGIACVVGAFVLMTYNSMEQEKGREQRETLRRQAVAQEGQERPPAEVAETQPLPATVEAAADPLPAAERDPAIEAGPEEIVTLENEMIRVEFSSRSGAISKITLKEYPAELDSPYDVELKGKKRHALELAASGGREFVPLIASYRLADEVPADPWSVTFVATLRSGLEITRSYRLSPSTEGPDPYTIDHEIRITNNGQDVYPAGQYFINLGTAEPTSADRMGYNLNASYYDDGDYRSISSSKFRSGGFLFYRTEAKSEVPKTGNLQWASVKNQFFVSIFTPTMPGTRIIASPVTYPVTEDSQTVPLGVTAEIAFDRPALPPGDTVVLAGEYYAGPKDFSRLSKMEMGQDEVMQLGWFVGMSVGLISIVAKGLLTLLSGIHGAIGNWGFAIILTTLVIRLLLWPLTAKAARASKRMQKIQKPLQDIREKYKDNPQKQQEATMALFKEHKINPLSGCWPLLIQFPIFIAFFNLLRSSSDLRFADFLWIRDLSMPDGTIQLGDTYLPLIGNSINVLPFIWLVTMHFQMKLMPQPSIDNAQAKMIKYMPYIFFPFTYMFSSGLVLYWSTTNCFSILQQFVTNARRKDEDGPDVIDVDAKEVPKKQEPLIRKKKKKKKDEGPGGLGMKRR